MKKRSVNFVKKLIQENQYLTLSSVNKNNSWSCTLTYAFDKNFNLYFMSEPSSKHVQDINKNQQVSATIYNSQQIWGEGYGLQIVGKVVLVDSKEAKKISNLFFKRNYPFGGIPKPNNIFKDAIDDEVYKFYKLTMTEIWVTDPEAKVDGRILVKL